MIKEVLGFVGFMILLVVKNYFSIPKFNYSLFFIIQFAKRNFTIDKTEVMIQSFKHKGLKLFWEQGNSSKLPADQIGRIERMLEIIDTAKQVPEDFGAFQNWNIHKLSGDLKAYWSIKVSKNYRIIFQFDGQNAYDLDYTDYH